jgi:hypothetical protein
MEPNQRDRGLMCGAPIMSLRLPTAAFVVTLLVSGTATAFAGDAAAEDGQVCGGRAPFREVAQDEVYTFDERCSVRDDFLRPDRARTGTGAVGWAKAHGVVPMRKD